MSNALTGIGRIERVTLGDRVHAELKELLVSGALAPGEKLSLRRVATSLGVSMMPVRDAVTRLVADDALTVLPNRAVTVPVMTCVRFRELTTVRLAIEGYAVERAASTRSESDLEAIRRFDALFRAEATAKQADALAALRLNKDLHFAVYTASALPTLVGIIEKLWLKVGPVINLDLRASPKRLATSGAEKRHGRMVTALDDRDGAAAREALQEDIQVAADFIEATGRLPE